MKTTLVAIFLLLAVSAFGQASAGAISAEAHMTQVPDHPQHAEMHAMANEHSLLGSGGVTSAQGERPLWEFGTAPAQQTPLGDIARSIRKEKLAAKKAQMVFEMQGRST